MTDEQHALRARQLNPHDELFWKSRGWKSRPSDWRERLARGDVHPPEHNLDLHALLNPPIIPPHMVMSAGDRANQKNPDNVAYWKSRGWDEMPSRGAMSNPNNDAYWVLKGYEERPDNWETRADASRR